MRAPHVLPLAAAAAAAGLARAATTTPTDAPTPSAISVSAAVASATAPASASLPSQVPLPPPQAWCPSKIFCAGELLQTVNIAQVYADPKTFVDKPTADAPQLVVSSFANLSAVPVSSSTGVSADTYGEIVSFVDTNFTAEGGELEALDLGSSFNETPAFLANVSDPLVRAWAGIVHGYWTQLIRGTNASALCDGVRCESTLIPLNHTFVVPGGRFREQYYWDSYWIVEGLLRSELFGVANSTLQNFMDELDRFGFIPNGGRIYYLNRSQPPLFIWMLGNYVNATGDTSILARALPLAERELRWWDTNRTISVTSPYTNKTHAVARYAVVNSAPRPESYLTDYLIANDPALNASTSTEKPLDETARGALYAQLASGAESGWDYSTRFVGKPFAGGLNNTNPALRTYDIANHVPVDLNSILYKSHTVLASLYALPGSTRNASAATFHLNAASDLKTAILDLLWDPARLAFYDFNTTAAARGTLLSAATFYPLWAGITPDALLEANSTNAYGFFSSLHVTLARYNGTYPPTFAESGLQWDAPNAWPPHQYIALQALLSLPSSNVTSSPLPSPQAGSSTFALVPQGQLGFEEGELPAQTIAGSSVNASRTGAEADLNVLEGGFVNGGNATVGEGWRDTLVKALANRYISSALCSWHSTGGEVPGLLPRLPDAALNVSGSIGNTGNMFEKFSIRSIDQGGSGGEYTVQAGFGWTNGVALWAAAEFGSLLVAPDCPNPLVETATPPSPSASGSATAAGASGTAGTGTGGTQTGGAGALRLDAALLALVLVFSAVLLV